MSALPRESVGLLRRGEVATVALVEGRELLMEELAQRPASASELARRLGQPRQKVNYHLRELERVGLVKLVEERRKGNCIERVVTATASSYLVSPEALAAIAPNPDSVPDRASSAYLLAAASEAIGDVGELRERAAAAGKKLATLTLRTRVRFATPEAMNAFAEELTDAVTKLAAKYHDAGSPEGREFKVMAASYPAITRGEAEAGSGGEERDRTAGLKR